LEKGFVTGMCLCEYWRGVAEKQGKIKKKQRKKNLDCEGMEEEEEEERCYDVEEIVDHEELDGELMVYFVKWKDEDAMTWELENMFDAKDDLLLANYWKKEISKRKKK
jgi:hypothetical protein